MSEHGGFSSGPYCGVKAVSVLAGVSVGEAADAVVAVAGYGPRWKGRTTLTVVRKALNRLGYRCREQKSGLGLSLGKWVEQHSKATGCYLVRTGGHFQAVVEQRITDQHASNQSAQSFHWRNKRVSHVLMVTPK